MSDALATLRTALAPKQGLHRIPIPLESYQHPSTPLSTKRLLNLMAEQEPSDARTAAALISTPGLTATATTFTTGPVLAMNGDYPGAIYAISGTHAYRVTLAGITDLGVVGTAALSGDFAYNIQPTIAVGVAAAVFCVPPNSFTCSHTDVTVNQITSVNYPGARSVTYIDGYFVFVNDDISSQFFCSLLFDPAAFATLDFAYADGVPNVLRHVVTHRGELWFIGDAGVEIWYNAGTADFPFRRQSGGVIPYGAASMKSVATGDGSVFWHGANNTVLRSKGYQVERISTHAIEDILRGLGTAATVSALTYAQGGHTFYCLTFTGRTFCYDCATKVWHERASSANGTGQWVPSAVAQVGEQVLFGSSTNGATFNPVPSSELEAGIAVLRQAILPPLWGGTSRAFCSRVEIEMESGGATPPGNITLQWSDDGGSTFNTGRTMNAGTAGSDRLRVYATRLGSFRQRTFKITALHKVTIYAVDADITAGGS